MKKVISKKKQALIDEMNAENYKVGDTVKIKKKHLNNHSRSGEFFEYPTIEKIEGNKVTFKGLLKTVDISVIEGKYDLMIGADPFDRDMGRVNNVAFTLESILYGLDMLTTEEVGEELGHDRESYDIDGVMTKRASFNPYVYNKKGEKEYYQRGLVWSLEDKQNLVESIYCNVDCGKVLVRKRGFDELRALRAKGETELAFNDVVDGKQRLHAVADFIKGKFQDKHGNYFADLSHRAQIDFMDHQLFSYSEMPEKSEDALVLKQFLKLNFAGVPQSKEHLEHVKEILGRS